MDGVCDICDEPTGGEGCLLCIFGNPCLRYEDYDLSMRKCTSNGACAL